MNHNSNKKDSRMHNDPDKSNLEEIIKEQRLRIEDLKKEINILTNKMAKIDEDYLVLAKNWGKELENKQNECDKLALSLEKVKKDAQNRITAIETQKKKSEDDLKSQLIKQDQDYKLKLEEMQLQMQSFDHFKIKEEQLKMEIDSWKTKYDKAMLQYNDDVAKMQKAIVKEKAEAEVGRKAREFRIGSEVNSEKNYPEDNADTKDENSKNMHSRYVEENKRLYSELETLKKEAESLRKEKERLIEENKAIKRNALMQEDGVVEYQTVNFRQATKIKKLKEKVNYLKDFSSQETIRFTKEIENLKYQNQIKVNELELQIRTYADELKLKTRELKNLKTLAQMILDQRSDIERFFLEALEYVREEIKKEELKKGLKYTNKLPELGTIGKMSHLGQIFIDNSKIKPSGERVDFSTLSWQEKEKILRVLFFKINNGSATHGSKSWNNHSNNVSMLDKIDTNIQSNPMEI